MMDTNSNKNPTEQMFDSEETQSEGNGNKKSPLKSRAFWILVVSFTFVVIVVCLSNAKDPTSSESTPAATAASDIVTTENTLYPSESTAIESNEVTSSEKAEETKSSKMLTYENDGGLNLDNGEWEFKADTNCYMRQSAGGDYVFSCYLNEDNNIDRMAYYNPTVPSNNAGLSIYIAMAITYFRKLKDADGNVCPSEELSTAFSNILLDTSNMGENGFNGNYKIPNRNFKCGLSVSPVGVFVTVNVLTEK